ncbi:hypothetical protein NKJ06_25935 [Mesorhizobium sp. M0293]|uniref:hypothetical protein n=1 Tax=Mesorhizobium sp. M0293 TaxID=2956930 RepID=UPI0033365018
MDDNDKNEAMRVAALATLTSVEATLEGSIKSLRIAISLLKGTTVPPAIGPIEAVRQFRAANPTAATADAVAALEPLGYNRATISTQMSRQAQDKPAPEERPMRNGVIRPRPDTLCGRAWAVADELAAYSVTPSTADVIAHGVSRGLNPGNLRTEFTYWKKFHGLGKRTGPEPEMVLPEGGDMIDAPVAYIWAFHKANPGMSREAKVTAMVEMGMETGTVFTQTSRFYKYGTNEAFLASEREKRAAKKAILEAARALKPLQAGVAETLTEVAKAAAPDMEAPVARTREWAE